MENLRTFQKEVTVKLFKAGSIICLCLIAGVCELQAGGWSNLGFEQTEQQAKQKRLPLLVHFYADWCGPCSRMEQEVFSSPEVASQLSTGLLAVKVNSDVRRDLAGRFGVSSLPTDIYIAPDGRVLSRFVGATGRSTFLNRLQRFASVDSALVSKRVSTSSQTPVNRELQSTEPAVKKVAFVAQERVSKPDVPTDDTSASVDEKPDTTEGPADTGVTAAESKKIPPTRRTALRRVAEKRLGIGGYSPVSLTESEKWVSGKEEFTHDYQGVIYRMANAEELQRFTKSPEKYIPILHGCDPVAFVKEKRIASGMMEFGTGFQNRVFFFASQKNRDEFRRRPEEFVRPMQLTFFESETNPGG